MRPDVTTAVLQLLLAVSLVATAPFSAFTTPLAPVPSGGANILKLSAVHFSRATGPETNGSVDVTAVGEGLEALMPVVTVLVCAARLSDFFDLLRAK